MILVSLDLCLPWILIMIMIMIKDHHVNSTASPSSSAKEHQVSPIDIRNRRHINVYFHVKEKIILYFESKIRFSILISVN